MSRSPIRTDKSLKDLLEGNGVLCLTMGVYDYISVGNSFFIGIRKIGNGTVSISISAPRTEDVQRYIQEVKPNSTKA